MLESCCLTSQVYCCILYFFVAVSLEDENKALKNEYVRLAQDTDDVEAKEQQLVKDITGQLGK